MCLASGGHLAVFPLFQKMSCSHVAGQWQPGLQTLGGQNPEAVLCAASSHFIRHLFTCQRETELGLPEVMS